MAARKKTGSSGWLAVQFLIAVIGGGTVVHQSTSGDTTGAGLSTTTTSGPATISAPTPAESTPTATPTPALASSAASPIDTTDPASTLEDPP